MKLGLYYRDSYAFSRFKNIENTHSLECASRDIMYLLKVPYILSEPIARGTKHCDQGLLSSKLRDSLSDTHFDLLFGRINEMWQQMCRSQWVASWVMMGPSLVLVTVLTALSFPISEYKTVQFKDHSPKFIRLSLSLSGSSTRHKRRQRCASWTFTRRFGDRYGTWIVTELGMYMAIWNAEYGRMVLIIFWRLLAPRGELHRWVGVIWLVFSFLFPRGWRQFFGSVGWRVTNPNSLIDILRVFIQRLQA